jgi:hypothetical protein
MDIKQLLEKMDQFAGEKVGQKPGDQWRGSDNAPPGKKLVGDSILKDLSKGPRAKTKAEELAEEYQAFLEAEFKDTVEKRPARKNARPSRGHEPEPRYKTIKADEGAMSDKDIELQDYRSMSHKEFQAAYGMTKTEWINQNKALVIKNPSIKKALGLEEGWESGPEEYEEPYDDADDAYDRMRQDKIDTEAEKEWAKLPKVSTYKLIGRGPNMEPNYEFGDEFDSMEQALEYRAKIMKDPKTPHPEHIGIRTITRLADQADESRGHKVVATKLANIERAKKFASGELKIPTPQERQAQLKKLEKATPVKEYGASNNVTPYGQPATDPKKAAQIAQGAQAFKAATGITAPATNIAKALDDASQGKPADRTSMKVLEPAMQDLVTIMSDPKLGSEYKSLAQKVNQKQQKPQ